MASVREGVIEAVVRLWRQAAPNADVKRNPTAKPRVGPGGVINVRDGDPGPPEVDLSPLRYNYEHRIPCEVLAMAFGSTPAAAILDDVMTRFGALIAANRTLGGLAQFVDVEAPTFDEILADGAAPIRVADLAVVVQYATPNPLT